MTDHLPECDLSRDCGLFHGQDYCHNCEQSCICAALRACEQRVLDDDVLAAAHHGQKGYEVGFRKGLDAAREAVAAIESKDLEIDWDKDYAVDPSGNTRNPRVWLRDAVTAIHALRGDL